MDRSPDSCFCWRPSWFIRFESLWSMLRRFAFFNEATAKNLQDAFGAGATRPYLWVSRKRGDLRSYGGLDPLRLTNVFGVDKETLDETTVLPFIADYEHELLTSERVRFCHSCLKDGFHSSLHQILLLKGCPVHGERLTEECQRCKTRLDYTLRTAPFATGIGCPDCVDRPGSDIEIRRRFNASSNERAGKFLAAARFVLRRREMQIPGGAASIAWMASRKPANVFARRMSNLHRYWQQVVDGSADISNTPAHETYTSFQYRAKPSNHRAELDPVPVRRDRYYIIWMRNSFAFSNQFAGNWKSFGSASTASVCLRFFAVRGWR
jgi:TniQ